MTNPDLYPTIRPSLIPTIYSQGYMVATCELEDMFECCWCAELDFINLFKKHHIQATMCNFRSNELYLARTPTPEGYNRYFEMSVKYHCVIFKRRSDAVKFKMVYSEDWMAMDKIFVIKRGDTYLSVKKYLPHDFGDDEGNDIDSDFPNPLPVCVEWVRNINKAYRSYTKNSILPGVVGAEYISFNCTNDDLHTPVSD